MVVDFIIKLSINVLFLHVTPLMVAAESLTKRHSAHPAGFEWLFTYTTVNKTMNDTEIIIDTSRLIKQTYKQTQNINIRKMRLKFLLTLQNLLHQFHQIFFPHSFFIFWPPFLRLTSQSVVRITYAAFCVCVTAHVVMHSCISLSVTLAILQTFWNHHST